MANKKITITLTDSNAWALELVSAILKKPAAEIVSSCLKGSTNLDRQSAKNRFRD